MKHTTLLANTQTKLFEGFIIKALQNHKNKQTFTAFVETLTNIHLCATSDSPGNVGQASRSCVVTESQTPWGRKRDVTKIQRGFCFIPHCRTWLAQRFTPSRSLLCGVVWTYLFREKYCVEFSSVVRLFTVLIKEPFHFSSMKVLIIVMISIK